MPETYIQLANRIFGKLTDDQADTLLWHCTAFPCIDNEMLINQLTKIKEESGGDFAIAMKQADDSIKAAMAGPEPSKLAELNEIAQDNANLPCKSGHPIMHGKITLRPIKNKMANLKTK